MDIATFYKKLTSGQKRSLRENYIERFFKIATFKKTVNGSRQPKIKEEITFFETKINQ